MIIPATRQEARNANRIRKTRPISAMASFHRQTALATRISAVMPGLVPGIHALPASIEKTWTAGSSPAMTSFGVWIISIRHRHRAQRLALAGGELFRLRLQLAAGGEDVAAARGAHRGGVAGVEDIFGEFLDLLPVGALVTRARPGIERDQVDLRRNALEQLHEQLGVVKRIVDALQHHVFESDAPCVGSAGIV